MHWWVIGFRQDLRLVYRYIKANNIMEAVQKIPQQNWNLDFAFVESIEIIDNGFGSWDEATGVPL